MAQEQSGFNPEVKSLIERLETLEKRLVKVESLLRLEWVGDKVDLEELPQTVESHTADQTESTIVEYGLAWIGSIVLFLGIIFLTSYLSGLGYQISSVIFGYLAAIIILGVVFKWGSSLPILSKVLILCSTLLFYYLTITLYFFRAEPLLNNKTAVLALSLLIITGQFYYAVRRGSERQ